MADEIEKTEITVEVETPKSPTSPTEPSEDKATDYAFEMGEMKARLQYLEGENAELRLKTEQVAFAASDAADIAETALDTQEEILDAVETNQETIDQLVVMQEDEVLRVAETPTVEVEDDTPPGKPHWLHRSWNEWRGR